MLKISTILRPAAVLLGLCMSLEICPAADRVMPAPLAQFRFNGDGKDETKANPAFELKNTQFKDNALYLNGKYEHNSSTKDGYHAVCMTPKLDYTKFTVALRFKPEEFGSDQNNLLTGGKSCRWFGMNRSAAGNLTITLNNQRFTHEIKGAAIEKGKWTVVACGVDLSAHKVVVYLNGKESADIDLPKDFKLDVLDSRFKDTDKNWSFTNYSIGSVFHGLVDGLVIYGEMLSPEELAQVSQSQGESPK